MMFYRTKKNVMNQKRQVMRNKILMICFLGYILLTGCMDDKTNLNYTDIVLPDTVNNNKSCESRSLLPHGRGLDRCSIQK